MKPKLDTACFAHLESWRGRRESGSEWIAAAPPAALSATLDREDTPARAGDALPPAYHWLYFLPVVPISQVGADGHPDRGGFLPPVPLPRRMWGAGRLSLRSPLRIGQPAVRDSEITDVRMKDGRSGALVFVTVRHIYRQGDDIAIVEEQDLVYRDKASGRLGVAAPAPQPAPALAAWSIELTPDPVLLFRYSALTFNGHRIHYDRPYAIGVEGYPGLVVHGPLVATLLLDLVRRHRPDAQVARFEFRAVQPLFDGSPLRLCGNPSADGREIALWAQDAAGALCMSASATLA